MVALSVLAALAVALLPAPPTSAEDLPHVTAMCGSDVSEAGDVAGTVTVYRFGGDYSEPLKVSVHWHGTATNGVDYEEIASVVEFPSGVSAIVVEVVPLGDLVGGESEEFASISLVAGDGYTVGSPSACSVGITDSAGVYVTAVDASASEPAGDPGAFRIVRGGDTSGQYNVSYTVSGTAQSTSGYGQDYAPLGDWVSFAAGETYKDIVVNPRPDNRAEYPEVVVIELVDGTFMEPVEPTTATVTISDAAAAPIRSDSFSAGGHHTCGLVGSRVECWGENTDGQLGNGTRQDSSVPVQVRGIATATAISSGFHHSCALLADRTVACWGNNEFGQLGNGTTQNALVPVPVQGLSDAVAISGGVNHTCAVLIDGTARCWGRNSYGQLGDGTSLDSSSPVIVEDLGGVSRVSVGAAHSCALLAAGSIRCWGYNDGGQLGDGTTQSSTSPVQVEGVTTATALSADLYHACALLGDRTVSCWGSNSSGELGSDTAEYSAVPLPVQDLTNATAVSAGGSHTCALLVDRTARCWGANLYGELGNGSTQDSSVPVEVEGLSGATAISGGGVHSCAVLSDRSARCWGYNVYGQLGDGTNIYSTVPVTVLDYP